MTEMCRVGEATVQGHFLDAHGRVIRQHSLGLGEPRAHDEDGGGNAGGGLHAPVELRGTEGECRGDGIHIHVAVLHVFEQVLDESFEELSVADAFDTHVLSVSFLYVATKVVRLQLRRLSICAVCLSDWNKERNSLGV